jgi:hypothetical protein
MAEKISIAELAKGERVFLHDMANHIVVAHGMANFVHRSLKDNKAVAEKDIDRLERAIEAINKMTALLKERRNLLLTLSE